MNNIEHITRKQIIPQVIPNYLAVEKSIRSLPYWEVCGECKGFCCTNNKGIDRDANHVLSEFDREVLAITFPEWPSHTNKEKKQHPNASKKYPNYLVYCDFNSDTGCIIPEGRPAMCTSYVCYDGEMYDQNISHDINTEVMRGHYKIAIALGGLLPTKSSRSVHDRMYESVHMGSKYNVAKPQIEDRVMFINSTFKKSEKIINSHKDFKVKFNFKSIKMPSI
jgi:hypothetical protein